MKKIKKAFVITSLLFFPLTGTLTACNNTSASEPIKYGTVSVADGIANGTVSATKLGNVALDTEITILASPDSGYEVDSYFLNDVKLESNTFKVKEGSNIIKATFKPVTPLTEYGTVEIMSSKVTNGTIAAKLEDGTLIDKSHKRFKVGTKVFVDATPVNKAYQVTSIKLNDTTEVNKDTDGKYSFLVTEGKNFLGAAFDLIHPGKGLIDLDSSYKNGTVVIKNGDAVVNSGDVIDKDTELKITATAADKYIVRYVKVNGKELAKSESEDTYSFKVNEGLVSIEVSFVFKATSLAINIPDSWIKVESRWGSYYLVEQGETYDLGVTLTPEGSFADLSWKKGEYDKDIEIKDGKLTVLNASENTNTITVSLKDNDSIQAEVEVKPISSGTRLARKLKDKLETAKAFEIANTKKVTFRSIVNDDYSNKNNQFDFESYSDGYTVTKKTDKEGTSSYVYQGINDNTFYTLKKEGTKVSSLSSTDIDDSNKAEYQDYLKTFGSAEFLDNNGLGTKYTGLADLYQKRIIDQTFSLDGNQKEIRASLVGLKDKEGYKFTSTCTTTGLRRVKYKTDVTSTLSFNARGGIDSISYKRVDHQIDDDGNLVASAKDQITEYTATIEYGTKEADPNHYFNFSDYYYTAFDLNLYTDKSDKEGSKLTMDSEGKYHLYVSQYAYGNLTGIVPETALSDIDDITVTKDSGINAYGSVKSGYTFYSTKAGEYHVTLASKNVTKTLTFVVSYAPIEKIEFKTIPDSIYCDDKTEIKATVSPSGVENSNVTYTIEGENLGCSIVKEGSKYRLQAGSTAGTIMVKATADGDSTKSVTKSVLIKETPSIYDSIKGNSYRKSEMDYYTYNTTYYTVSFTDVSKDVLKGTLIIESEDYYREQKTTLATFRFDVAVKGAKLTLTNITCDKDDFKDKLSSTRTGNLKSDGTLDGISITYDGTTLKLPKKSTSSGGSGGGDWGDYGW